MVQGFLTLKKCKGNFGLSYQKERKKMKKMNSKNFLANTVLKPWTTRFSLLLLSQIVKVE